MGLIYGNTFLKENNIISVAYQEYCNYNGLLESCVSEEDKYVLEAKVEVLKEVAIKDILEKISTAFRIFKEWFNKILKNFREKIANLFNKKKAEIDNLKSKTSEEDNVKVKDVIRICNVTTEEILLHTAKIYKYSTYELLNKNKNLTYEYIIRIRSISDSRDKYENLQNCKEEAEKNLNEFLNYKIESKIIDQELEVTKKEIVSKAETEIKKMQVIQDKIKEYHDNTKKDIDLYGKNLEEIKRKINKAKMSSSIDEKVDINYINQLFLAIDSDIFRFKRVIKKQLDDAGYISLSIMHNLAIVSKYFCGSSNI